MDNNTSGVTLSDYRRKAEQHGVRGFDSRRDLRDRLPGVLRPHQDLVWRVMVHGEPSAADQLHEILLDRRWAIVSRTGTGSDDKSCVLRGAGQGRRVEASRHSCIAKVHFLCILQALEIEAEDAFVGA